MPLQNRRTYLLYSLGGSLLLVLLLSLTFGHFSSQLLIQQETRANANLTRILAKAIWPRFAGFIEETRGKSPLLLARAPEIAELDAIAAAFLDDDSVLKIKLYNLEGFTIYSSEHAQIGQYKADNPGFRSALQGQVRSVLAYRKTFHGFERSFTDRNLISTYLPLHDPQTGAIRGVFEVYSDVSAMAEAIAFKRWLIAGLALPAWLLLFGGLYLIQRRLAIPGA